MTLLIEADDTISTEDQEASYSPDTVLFPNPVLYSLWTPDSPLAMLATASPDLDAPFPFQGPSFGDPLSVSTFAGGSLFSGAYPSLELLMCLIMVHPIIPPLISFLRRCI